MQPSTASKPSTDNGMVEYGKFVGRLMKKMPTDVENQLHAAVGIAGEAGELLDAVKKRWAYNKPLDEANVKEELGDLLFYIQAMCNCFGWSMQEVLGNNVVKLAMRYPSMTYSDAAAQARADKVAQ